MAAAGLLGLSGAGSAQAPTTLPLTQNERGACVSAGVHDRFREAGTAQSLAREIVAACIPERRRTVESDPGRRAYFDLRYADDRDSALEMSALQIERLRRNAAAAASIAKGQPTLTEPVAKLILGMARQSWGGPLRISQIRLRTADRPSAGREWLRLADRKMAAETELGRIATYYADASGRVIGLFVDSGAADECRTFRARETLAVSAALMAVPTATPQEIGQVRAAVRAGWTSGLSAVPARIGPYVLRASRIGRSAPGRTGCHDHLSLTLAAD